MQTSNMNICPNAGSEVSYNWNPGTGDVHMDHVDCDVSQQTLISCKHDPEPNCDHSQDAQVLCRRELWYQFCTVI